MTSARVLVHVVAAHCSVLLTLGHQLVHLQGKGGKRRKEIEKAREGEKEIRRGEDRENMRGPKKKREGD